MFELANEGCPLPLSHMTTFDSWLLKSAGSVRQVAQPLGARHIADFSLLNLLNLLLLVESGLRFMVESLDED